MPDDSKQARSRFGTFGGVFTPCVLMILGVILFLRLGQVLGQAGLVQCLAIILFAKLITTLTALSLSSLATNTRVRGGGAYYLISRSLGIEYGGAIGPVFYLALATSVALYVIGFTEALIWLLPEAPIPFRATASGVLLFVFVCVYLGANWTIRLQYLILAVIALALVSFLAGAWPVMSLATLETNLEPAYGTGQTIFSAYALFFPAVTGIMAGVNLSGDLEEPGAAIPRGTLIAIALTGTVYVTVAVALAAAADRAALSNDAFILGSMAISPALVAAGVFAATLSSALSSMMGAPRILQALARDGVFRVLRPFARTDRHNREPRSAIMATFVIAEASVLLGDLDTIAPLITMFFMITYGAINLSCFYETITGNPSFRPLFKLRHWSIGLAGAVACALGMLLVAPGWAIFAAALLATVLYGVKQRELVSRWGDVRWGAAYEQARRALLRLEEERYHPKSWRPSILAVRAGRWTSEYRVAEYAAWLQGGRGIVTLAQIVQGEVEDRMARRRKELLESRRFIHAEHLDAFSTVIVDDDLLSGLRTLLQSHGIGSIHPNTVLFEWQHDPDRSRELADLVDTARAFECSAVAVLTDPRLARWVTRDGPIDVWWHSRKNGALMLMFAYLMTRSHAWRDRRIRLLHAVATAAERDEMLPALEELIATARVRAEPQVVITEDVSSAVERTSTEAGVVIVGMDPPEAENASAWHADLCRLTANLDEVLLVSSAGDVRLGD